MHRGMTHGQAPTPDSRVFRRRVNRFTPFSVPAAGAADLLTPFGETLRDVDDNFARFWFSKKSVTGDTETPRSCRASFWSPSVTAPSTGERWRVGAVGYLMLGRMPALVIMLGRGQPLFAARAGKGVFLVGLFAGGGIQKLAGDC